MILPMSRVINCGGKKENKWWERWSTWRTQLPSTAKNVFFFPLWISDWAGHWNSASFNSSKCPVWGENDSGRGHRGLEGEGRGWWKRRERLLQPRKAPWGTAQGGEGAEPRGPWAELASQGVAKELDIDIEGEEEQPGWSQCQLMLPSRAELPKDMSLLPQWLSHISAFSRG